MLLLHTSKFFMLEHNSSMRSVPVVFKFIASDSDASKFNVAAPWKTIDTSDINLSFISWVMPSPSEPTSPHTTCSLDNSDLFVFLMESNNCRRNIVMPFNVTNNNIYYYNSYRGFDDFLVPQKSRLASFWSYQHENVLYSRTAVQQFPDEYFSHEARTSGDEHGPVVEKLRYFACFHLGLDLLYYKMNKNYDDKKKKIYGN